MERFELDAKLKDEIRARTLGTNFMKLVQSVRRNGKTFKIAMRPVEISGERRYQAEMTDDGQVMVKNLSLNAAAQGLEEIIAQRGARDLHLMCADGDLHVRVTKKGHALVSRSATMQRTVALLPHDHVKKTPLTRFDASALLRVIGVSDGSGAIRASMRGKYDQVNDFLRVVGETVGPRTPGDDKPFVAVDCGCGKAYLTLALWFYLSQALEFPNVRVIGIDRRRDVITAAKKMAEQLDVADKVLFAEADLMTFDLRNHPDLPDIPSFEHVDLVTSLHACDTATDEALARGIEWKARHILSAPCCQHELQKTIASTDVFAGLMRQSILRERLCDILTDAFRAMILRILGYKTQVIEFVSHEATARNIMIRAIYGVKPGQPGPVGEYLSLRDYWHVTPWLETRLGERLQRLFMRYE